MVGSKGCAATRRSWSPARLPASRVYCGGHPTIRVSSTRRRSTRPQVAALLRNVHLAHGGGDDDPFAITITSQRVRLAQRIFDGRARRPQSRRSARLSRRARPSRTGARRRGGQCPRGHAPSRPGDAADPGAPARRPRPAPAVGRQRRPRGRSPRCRQRRTRPCGKKAAGVLRRLGVAVDAAADLLQAEQVHQFARGNLTAAVNTLGDIDRGLDPAARPRLHSYAAQRRHGHAPGRHPAGGRRRPDRRDGRRRPHRRGPKPSRRSTPGWRGASARLQAGTRHWWMVTVPSTRCRCRIFD